MSGFALLYPTYHCACGAGGSARIGIVHNFKECYLKKAIYLPVIVSFLLSIGPHLAGPLLKDAAAAETIGHFSNWQTSPETGDCGGYELWLTKSGNLLQGQLAVYEGNCESQKWNLENVKYDSKTGDLSFKAPYYHNDFFGCLRELCGKIAYQERSAFSR